LNYRADLWSLKQQQFASFLSDWVPFSWANRIVAHLVRDLSPRERYLARMHCEVFWLNRTHLRNHFIHSGVEQLDSNTTYVLTSIHFGHWAMYSASLAQQTGLVNQMVATGRNLDRKTTSGHFWYEYGHKRQDLSGFPACYSDESVFDHLRRLRRGRSLVVLADVREQSFTPSELKLQFMGYDFYLQRTVVVLARRAGVPILPYIGHFDEKIGKHRVQWFKPFYALDSDSATMQRVLELFEPTFDRYPEQYFNVFQSHTRPFTG